MVQAERSARTEAFAQNALYDRIFAVNAVVAIANSMGDLTEGLSWREVEERYGYLDRLLPQEEPERLRKMDWGPDFHYQAHSRPAGMGEDGQERHRLMCEAIIRKGGRVNVWDIARIWVELIDPAKFGILLGPQDQVIYWALKAGVPPTEVGRYATFPAFHGTTKMMLPVGLVNAGNPKQAALDARDCGRIKDTPGTNGSHAIGNYALDVAAGMTAAIATAMLPGATVGSVIDAALAELATPARTGPGRRSTATGRFCASCTTSGIEAGQPRTPSKCSPRRSPSSTWQTATWSTACSGPSTSGATPTIVPPMPAAWPPR
jgi:hypothetical protein